MQLPSEFSEQVGNFSNIQHFVDLYFVSIHTSFPIGLDARFSSLTFICEAETTL